MAEETGGEGRRRAWSMALAALGAFVLVVGAIFFYAREHIFDSDRFADHAVAALDDERTRAALTEPIVTTIIEQGSADLINAQPIIESAVSGVLGSAPFEALFRNAVREAHRALFNENTETLVLTLADAGIVVIEAVRAISPEAAAEIPDDLQPTLVEISENEAVTGVADLAQDFRVLGLILPFLGIALLIGSVALRQSSRDGVVVVSIAVAIATGVALAGYLVVQGLVISQFDDDLVSDAVAATWSAFLSGLFDLFLILGIASLIVAAAAYAGVRQVDPAAPFHRASELALRTPSRPFPRFLRALGILIFGLIFVLRPIAGVQILAVAVGGWALFIAVTEILLVIAPPPEAVTEGPGERAASLARRVRWRRLAAFGAGLVAIAIGFALVLAIP
ncbi:MAG: hypothetical protein ACR2N5_00535, partial [Solirubrobacterales bacterium]